MTFLSKTLLGTAAALVIAVGVSQSASAATTMTINPGLLTPALAANGNITFKGFNLSDYATIVVNNTTGAATETSILDVTSLIGATPSANTFNVASGFGLYFQVTATAQLAPSGGGLVGNFTSVSYTLYGYSNTSTNVGDTVTFASDTSVPVANTPTAPVAIGSGSLIFDTNNSVGITASGLPTASVDVTFIPSSDPNVSPFFVAPSAPFILNLDTSYINLLDEVSVVVDPTNTTYQLGSQFSAGDTPGGGSANLAVPEPVTLSVFGAALAGLGFVRRRKAN
jgi:hypothetical protein